MNYVEVPIDDWLYDELVKRASKDKMDVEEYIAEQLKDMVNYG